MKNKVTRGNSGMPLQRQDRDLLQVQVDGYVRMHQLVPPLSMEELRDHAATIASEGAFADYIMVLLNNAVWRDTVASTPYERRLLLLPQCLRDFRNCPALIDEFGLLCEECGRCCIGDLQSMAEDLGYVVLVAEGSTVVTKLLEGGKVDAVIGVSCLSALEKSFPHMADGAIPGLAIPLTMDGCISTQTDVEDVRWALCLKTERTVGGLVDTEDIRRQVDDWFSALQAAAFVTETERLAYRWLLKDGKRWRPFLLACTYAALRGDSEELPDEIRRLGIAVECFHKASLVHDDIEDGDLLRYEEPTLHCELGLPVALNVGDFLVGEGYRWIASVESCTAELFRIAVENHRMLCVGQGEELTGLQTQTPFSTRTLIEVFRRKTAPAFGAALQLGAIASGGDKALVCALGTFSESLGIAYQIRDDLDEYCNEEEHDLSASLLLSLANDQKPLEWLTTDSPNIKHLFDELMVVEKASQLLEHYKNEAIRALNPIQNAPLKSLLRRITGRMLDRKTPPS